MLKCSSGYSMRKVRKIREKLYVYGTGTALPSEHQLKQALDELKERLIHYYYLILGLELALLMPV